MGRIEVFPAGAEELHVFFLRWRHYFFGIVFVEVESTCIHVVVWSDIGTSVIPDVDQRSDLSVEFK